MCNILTLVNLFGQVCLQSNKSVVYELIASHGDMDDLVFFADLMNDHEKVITHRLQSNEYDKAIAELQKVVIL